MGNSLIAAAVLVLTAAGSPWEADITLGGLFTTGNTEASRFDTALKVSRSLGRTLTGSLQAGASYGSQNRETYREKYLTRAILRWDFTESDFALARGYWSRDEFSGVRNEYGSSAGYGRRLISGEAFRISAEAGAGYLIRKNVEDATLKTSTWYSGLELGWDISDSFLLTETAVFSGDLEDSANYSLESTLEVSSAITGNLAMLVGYHISHHNLPPVEGSEKTDTALIIQLRLDL